MFGDFENLLDQIATCIHETLINVCSLLIHLINATATNPPTTILWGNFTKC